MPAAAAGARDTALHPFPDDDDLPAGTLAERTATLRASVDAVAERPCAACGARLCGHEAVFAVLLGARHAPRCAACAARELDEDRAALCERARQWILRRDCFLAVFRAAGEREGFGTTDRPSCLFAATPTDVAAAAPSTAGAVPPVADAVHDAGDLGCGDLVIDLKFRLADLPPGTVLEVRATDPAAPIDLPAWCGLVGHTLLQASPPRYWIRRKPR